MKEVTINKIKAAIGQLQQNNKRITVRNVAEAASTSKDNARLYIKSYLNVPVSNDVPDLEYIDISTEIGYIQQLNHLLSNNKIDRGYYNLQIQNTKRNYPVIYSKILQYIMQ